MQDVLFHLANLVLLVSYSVRDIVLLRTLLIVANGFMFSHVLTTHDGFSLTSLWSLTFIIINTIWVAVLYFERRPVQLSEKQNLIYQKVFSNLSPRDFLRLTHKAQWVQADPGQVLIEKHKPLTALFLIARGQAFVDIGGDNKIRLSPGQFLGEMSLLTHQPPSAHVIASEGLEYLRWERADLERTFQRWPKLKGRLQETLGLDLVKKLSTPS